MASLLLLAGVFVCLFLTQPITLIGANSQMWSVWCGFEETLSLFLVIQTEAIWWLVAVVHCFVEMMSSGPQIPDSVPLLGSSHLGSDADKQLRCLMSCSSTAIPGFAHFLLVVFFLLVGERCISDFCDLSTQYFVINLKIPNNS